MNYTDAIAAAARAEGIPPEIALAVAHVESGTRQYDRGGRLVVSPKGAIGIMQVMPATAPGVDLAHAEWNIEAGVRELARLYREFGTWALALAAYNWGEGRVRDVLAGRRHVPAEVSGYVAKVLGCSDSAVADCFAARTYAAPAASNHAGILLAAAAVVAIVWLLQKNS